MHHMNARHAADMCCYRSGLRHACMRTKVIPPLTLPCTYTAPRCLPHVAVPPRLQLHRRHQRGKWATPPRLQEAS